MVYDAFTTGLSFFLALWFRFDCQISSIPQFILNGYKHTIIFQVLLTIVVFLLLRLYTSIWKFASFYEFVRTAFGCIGINVVYTVFVSFLYGRMPITYFLFGSIFQFFFVICVRFMYRAILLLRNVKKSNSGRIKNVLIYGAGNAGRVLARDIIRSGNGRDAVIGFIDDDESLWKRSFDGIEVLGGREDIMSVVDKYDVQKIYVALPSVAKSELKEILSICSETKCEVFNLPGIQQLCSGQIRVTDFKEVKIEDLLGRDPIKVNNSEIGEFLEGKKVLITGAGGSIGSELSRQVAKNNPSQLILFDVYENGVYDIQLELKRRYPFLNLVVLIGSVRDSRRMFQIFNDYKPQIVYHAAAHKHVPLMEASPSEAIKNNAIGTYKTAFAAMLFCAERFVLISPDKAVNPTNIMGASKRLCEMIIQSFDAKVKAGDASSIPQLFTHNCGDDFNQEKIAERLKYAHTEFVAVRFGNVLGLNGSVVPIFKKQIENGGPVTVTHPDIIRYFMTIPEAVSLVLQAGTYAKGGEIFVLDMGEPVKIDTLARNLIRLSGYVPDVDIKVEYTGLRPGEKLYEEKLMAEEGMKKTDNDLIYIGSPIDFNHEEFIDGLEALMNAAYENNDSIKEYVAKIVTTYKVR
ncbi:MAG: polysaccharide biosynthesis protein [Clostridia bacterium]|nr:polysaccharide biosynthesis protein [Clostridia bacterium]